MRGVGWWGVKSKSLANCFYSRKKISKRDNHCKTNTLAHIIWIFLYLPLFHSGWHSFRSLQVRAGFFWEPSGLRRFSIWLLRDLSVESTSTSCCLRELEASSALMYLRGSGDFSVWPRPAKADMSMPGPGGPGGPGGPALPGGPWRRARGGNGSIKHIEEKMKKHTKMLALVMDFVLFCYVLQDQSLQNVPEVQGVRWDRVFHLLHLCQQVRLVQVVPTETTSIESKRSANANMCASIWNNT